jgi:DNA-binding LacI/PurR family transcriptional regulator
MALVATNGLMALGAMGAALDAGLHIPTAFPTIVSLEVIAFDQLEG